jgi:hypothetical protein
VSAQVAGPSTDNQHLRFDFLLFVDDVDLERMRWTFHECQQSPGSSDSDRFNRFSTNSAFVSVAGCNGVLRCRRQQ